MVPHDLMDSWVAWNSPRHTLSLIHRVHPSVQFGTIETEGQTMSGANTPNLVAVRYEERLRLFAESPRLASHLNLTAGALIWESGKNRSHQASETNCSLGSLSPRNARPQSWKPRSPFVNSPNCSPISAEERIGNHFPADCEGSRQFGFEHVSGLTILVPTQRDVSDLTILVPTQRDWFRTKWDWFRTKRDWFRSEWD